MFNLSLRWVALLFFCPALYFSGRAFAASVSEEHVAHTCEKVPIHRIWSEVKIDRLDEGCFLFGERLQSHNILKNGQNYCCFAELNSDLKLPPLSLQAIFSDDQPLAACYRQGRQERLTPVEIDLSVLISMLPSRVSVSFSPKAEKLCQFENNARWVWTLPIARRMTYSGFVQPASTSKQVARFALSLDDGRYGWLAVGESIGPFRLVQANVKRNFLVLESEGKSFRLSLGQHGEDVTPKDNLQTDPSETDPAEIEDKIRKGLIINKRVRD